MTAKIKLNAASGGGSFSLQAPSSSSNNRVFTLPDIADATMATVNGITHARTYRVPSNFTLSAASMTVTDWEYADTNSSGTLGSGWGLPSSGVFTFPATGIYLVKPSAMIRCASGINQPYMGIELAGTINNSSYVVLSQALSSQSDDFSADRFHNTHCGAIIDCTDTSNVKFKVNVLRDNNYGNIIFVGDSNANVTWVEVTRLGDT